MKKIALTLVLALATTVGFVSGGAFAEEGTESGSVSIVKGSSVNLVSRESSFPVAVTNSWPGEVRVVVHLRSSSAKLIVEQSKVSLVIPAGTTVNAKFPIRAIGSGDVVMVSWLTSLSGLELGSPVPIKLTVNPDIETTAIVLFLSFVAVLMVIGVIRTTRRRQSV